MKVNANFNNSVKIEGYVYSTGSNFNQLSERVTGEASKSPGTKYIAGDLEIATDEQGLNVVTIHYSYVTERYKSGSPNRTYNALKEIIDNPDKTWLASGKENALKVSCTGVSIGVNDFIAADGSKVAAVRNENGFCNIVSALNEVEEDRSTFSVDMLITKVTRKEADPEKGIKDEYVSVSGCVFSYGPKIVPISLVIRDTGGMKYFENLDVSSSNPVFTKIWGKVTNNIQKVERREESAFGEAAIYTFEKKTKEYLITGTSRIPYDFGDSEILTAEDVVKLSQERQVLLAEVEERFKERQAIKANGTNDFSSGKDGKLEIPTEDFIF